MCLLKNRNCLNCQHSSYWDGDYTCIEKMSILVYDVDHITTDDRRKEMTDKMLEWNLCSSFDREKDRKFRKVKREIFNALIKTRREWKWKSNA